MNTDAKIRKWVAAQPPERVIDPRRVARDLKVDDPVQVAVVLVELANAGVLERFYKVVTPSGVDADGEFTSVDDIPPSLPDRFEHYFSTSEADIRPLFRRGA